MRGWEGKRIGDETSRDEGRGAWKRAGVHVSVVDVVVLVVVAAAAVVFFSHLVCVSGSVSACVLLLCLVNIYRKYK